MLRGFTKAMVLEQKVADAMSGETVTDFLAAVASSAPVPGGGSVAAHVGALAGALTQMVAGLTVGRKKYVAVDGEMRALGTSATALKATLAALVKTDADAYSVVSAAYKLPKDSPDQQATRDTAIQSALMHAAAIPLDTARAATAVAALAATCAEKGNSNAASDAGLQHCSPRRRVVAQPSTCASTSRP